MLKEHPPLTTPETATKQTGVAAAALTTPEAAAYLNVKPATLEQWRWNGKGPRYCSLGRSIRYRIADLDVFLGARVFTSTTEAHSKP
jgi:excisionase family DNA binding protein